MYREETSSEEEVKENEKINYKSFQTNCGNAFDVVFNTWKKTKEKSLRLAIAECLGLLTEVMEPKILKKNFMNLINYFSELIVKEPFANQLPLIKGMCRTLKCIHRDALFEDDMLSQRIDLTLQNRFSDLKVQNNHKKPA